MRKRGARRADGCREGYRGKQAALPLNLSLFGLVCDALGAARLPSIYAASLQVFELGAVLSKKGNLLASAPGIERGVEGVQFAHIVYGILRCQRWGEKADRTCNFSDKTVAVVHDELIVRPGPAKRPDLADDTKIRRLAQRNAKACIRST